MTIAILDNYSDLSTLGTHLADKNEVIKASVDRAVLEAARGEYDKNGDLGVVYSRSELAAMYEKMNKGYINTFFIISFPDNSVGIVSDNVFEKKLNKDLTCLALPRGSQIEVIAAVSNNGFIILNPAAEPIHKEWLALSSKNEQKVSHVNILSTLFAVRKPALDAQPKGDEKAEEKLSVSPRGPAPAA